MRTSNPNINVLGKTRTCYPLSNFSCDNSFEVRGRQTIRFDLNKSSINPTLARSVQESLEEWTPLSVLQDCTVLRNYKKYSGEQSNQTRYI